MAIHAEASLLSNADLDAMPSGVETTMTKVLHRSLRDTAPTVDFAAGNLIHLTNGQKILDATGGAAVACLGHGNARITEAMLEQCRSVAYCHTTFFSTTPAEELARVLIDSTCGDMSHAFFVSSGSEAIESALKFARQYHLEKEPSEDRYHFISRRQSYHGATLGALGAGGHTGRRAPFEPLLNKHTSRVSPCYSYRAPGLDDAQYVAQLEKELEDEFQEVGPGKVAAFIAEPMVGAALGCVGPVPGYFEAMRRICDRHGALLILDEIMCGCGRIGPQPSTRYAEPLHAYQDPSIGVVPDIMTMGKALGAGYQAIGAMLISSKVVETLNKGSGAFVHGHTYQGHPIACRAALEVQRIIKQGLLENVRVQGRLLGELLHQRLDSHARVGNVRGQGLFWGVELVKDKTTKEPFDARDKIALRIHQLGLQEPHNISLYPGTGTVDGINGDHILLAPAYNCTAEDINLIVDTTAKVIEVFFQQYVYA